MSWRHRLQKGQFRTAAFLTEAHEETGGRRVALHEYPLRDVPFAEDLGKKAGEFTIDCYVLASEIDGDRRGDDYFDERDALRDEFRKPGPGILIHPYLGSQTVMVKEYRLRETTRDGGMAVFSVSFVEAGRPAEPDALADTPALVDASADAAIAASIAGFDYGMAGMPQYVADSATQKIQNLISNKEGTGLLNIAGKIASATSPITQFSAALNSFGSALGTLIRQPANLAADVVGVLVSLAGVAKSVQTAISGYQSLWSFGNDQPAPSTTTPIGQKNANNLTAINALVQRAATIAAARAAASLSFDSQDEATALREALAAQFDAIMQTAGDDVYTALADLRAATIKDITMRGADLAKLVRFTPRATLPALVIAYQLYGDAARDQEIVSRNHIRHPGFVPGGQPLQVLDD